MPSPEREEQRHDRHRIGEADPGADCALRGRGGSAPAGRDWPPGLSGEVAIDQIVDRPENGTGRSYLVESNIQPGDHLRSLIVDYTRQAAELGHCPMSAEALEVLLARGSRVKEAIS